jgi:hypothetical protein
VVYFPFNPDQTFWEVSAKDHLVLLRNAVAWATGEPQPMTVQGAGLVDVSYWRQDRSLAAHLVNLNNPSAMRGFMHETTPVGPFVVSLQLPPGARAKRVRLLEAEQEAKVRRDGDRLSSTFRGCASTKSSRWTSPSCAARTVSAADRAD